MLCLLRKHSKDILSDGYGVSCKKKFVKKLFNNSDI